MKIPKEFMLHGKKIKVIKDRTFNEKKPEIDGETSYVKNEIRLHDYKKENADESYVEQVFYHELVHHILFHMQENELGNNEKFVNLFSELLYQFIVTQKK